MRLASPLAILVTICITSLGADARPQSGAATVPPRPRSALKQLTRAELVQRAVSEHRRAVPMPSNKGYTDCPDPGYTFRGVTQFAELSTTGFIPVSGSGLAVVQNMSPAQCAQHCSDNQQCKAAQVDGTDCFSYNAYPSGFENTPGYTSLVLGNCATVLGDSGYTDPQATCCHVYANPNK